MTGHSNGLFRFWTASDSIDNAEQKPASLSLPETKALIFGATINFVRHSKIASSCSAYMQRKERERM
jgi:hypothetical protein